MVLDCNDNETNLLHQRSVRRQAVLSKTSRRGHLPEKADENAIAVPLCREPMPDTKAPGATLPVGFVYKNTLNPLNIELKKPRMARDEVNDHDVRQGTCALPTSRTGANPFGRNRPLTCVKWIIYAITRLIVFWCIIGTVLLVCFVSSNMPLFSSRTATLETKSFDEPVPLFRASFS